MRRKSALAAIFLVACTGASGGEQNMDAVTFGKWFSTGVSSETRRYEEARQHVVESGADALPLLRKEAAPGADWRARVTAEAWIAWIATPDLCRGVRDRMEGKLSKPLAPPPLTGTWSPAARGRSIAGMGAEATPCILEILIKTAEADEKEQEALFFALAMLRDRRAVDPLIALLTGRTRQATKRQAAYALGPIGDRAAVKPLVAILQDESTSAELKGTAAVSLGQIRDAEALQPLIDVFLNVENPLELRERGSGDWGHPGHAGERAHRGTFG